MTSQAQSNTKTSPNQVELRVPAEIWHEIFLLATLPDISDNEIDHFWTSTYRPFNSHYFTWPFGRYLVTLIGKHKLPSLKQRVLLVCKRWHAIALRCVYQVIYVGKHSSGLIAGLKRSEESCKGFGYGRLVRRIFLATRRPEAVRKHTFARVMKYCPNASTLVKSRCDLTPIPPTIPCLPSIKRFDWWWCGGSLGPSSPTDFYFIRDIVKQTPSLEHLSIGPYRGRYTLPHTNIIPDHTVETPISTLQLQSARYPHMLEELGRWSFPNLTNLIIMDVGFITSTPAPYLNRHIKIIELTEGLTNFHLLFAQCPNVQELYFYLDLQTLLPPSFTSSSLQRVGMRPSRLLALLVQSGAPITREFEVFCGNSFPALQTIILYGDGWSPIVHSEPFRSIPQQVARSGKVLQFENGSPISFDP